MEIKVLKTLLLMIVFLGSFYAENAVNQTEVCVSQCAAYTLAWRQNPAYVFITKWCSYGTKDMFLDIINAWASYVTRGPDFMTVMKSLQCAHDINAYIVPIIKSCKEECARDDKAFAPDLVVASDTVKYIEKEKRLYVRVINAGFAYIDSADVYIYAGYDDRINLDPPNMKLIHTEKLKCITPYNPAYVPYPNCWYEKSFSIPWEHEKDMFNVVKVVVQPSDPNVVEADDNDEYSSYNTYKLIVNDLPLPPDVFFDGSTVVKRIEPHTNRFEIKVNVTNRGELPGNYYINYYLGNQKYSYNDFAINANETITFSTEVHCLDAYPDYVRIEITDVDNNLIDYVVVYVNPQFLIVEGKVVDEVGNPIPNASVYIDNGKTPVLTRADGSYTFRHLRPFTTEGKYKLTAHKNGYVDNSTTINFVYNNSDITYAHDIYYYVDFVLVEKPKNIYVGYPSSGWYNILTDKGQYRGEYGKINGTSEETAKEVISAPIKGTNGIIVITSSNCTALIKNFTISENAFDIKIPPHEIKCLQPDSVDDYTPLSQPNLLWSKTYQNEIPHVVKFSKNGKYAYVLTVDSTDLFCKIYAYDLSNGNQLYAYKTNSMCLGKQASTLIPAYDGSRLYAGIAARKNAKRGDTTPKGYLFDQNGNVIEIWEWPEYAESLTDSSATPLLDIITSSGKFYAPGYGYIDECLLSSENDCNGETHNTIIRRLDVSRNRVIGECNTFSCIYTLNSPAHQILRYIGQRDNDGIQYNDEIVLGSYADENKFVAWKYNKILFYENGRLRGYLQKDLNGVSLSPGSKYIVEWRDPMGIEMYQVVNYTKIDINKTSQLMPIGMEATETGIYVAEYKSGKLNFYALSSIVESQSSTISGGSGQKTGFIEQVLNFFKGVFNYLFDLAKQLFGLSLSNG
ncbi:MAG: carboxypeptidase-like regulatory domain-containing protein [Candidatus Bilamarchaeaceae archaeon]